MVPRILESTSPRLQPACRAATPWDHVASPYMVLHDRTRLGRSGPAAGPAARSPTSAMTAGTIGPPIATGATWVDQVVASLGFYACTYCRTKALDRADYPTPIGLGVRKRLDGWILEVGWSEVGEERRLVKFADPLYPHYNRPTKRRKQLRSQTGPDRTP